MNQIVTFINSKGESIEFTDYSSYLIQNVDLGTVGATESTYTGYNQDGEVYRSSALEKRQVILKFAIVCDETAQLLKARNNLIKIFNPKLGQGVLRYVFNGVERELVCVADGLPLMPLEPSRTFSLGEITLLAHDPYFYDLSEIKVNVATWRNAFKFPLTIPNSGMIFGYKEPSLIANVINNGDVECGLTIEFIAKGTVKNPSLLNINTQEYIKVNRTMTAGERITVSTGYNNKKIVSELDGITTNIMNYLDLSSSFLQLEVGDNLFRYDADDNLSQLEVNIRYTQRYLGV